ncbi:MAG: hypothetical protein ACXQTR_02060 [Candidatus Methanospirareceae archaeon]
MPSVVDDLGLVLENQFMTGYIPATNRAMVFRVVSRVNKNYEVFNYGPLPLSAGDVLSSYDGGVAPVPADGVMPARAYTTGGIKFPLTDAWDETDMWYLPKDYRDRIFHVKLKTTPDFLRTDVQIPINVTQARFQRERKIIGVEVDFGFKRGEIEVIHFPEIHYGYRFGNDTNVAFYTHAEFVYGEYTVEIPKDAELIFNVLTKKVPSYWLTLPIMNYDAKIGEAFLDVYGFEGFPVYGLHEREKAIEEYTELLREVMI